MGGGGKGGGGGKKGGVSAPNFSQAALQTSMSSRPNWQGTMGGQTWSYDPKTGQPTMQQTSNYQGAFDALKGATQQAASLDPTQARNQAISSNYNQAVSRLDPQWGQNQQQFQSQMANLGGSDNPMAGMQAAGNFGRAQNDAYQSAMNNAIQLGNQTQSVQQAQQALPFQQLGMLQGAQNSTPYMGQGANMTDAVTRQYQAANAQQQQGKGALGSALGGLGGIAGTVFGGPVGGKIGGGLGSALGGGLGGGGIGQTPYDQANLSGPGF